MVQCNGSAGAAGTDDWSMFRHDAQHSGYSTSTAPSTNNTLWNYTTGWWVVSSPAVSDGKVYVGSVDGNVYCLNATTGAFMWSYTTGNMVNSSPAVSDGKVYVGSVDGKVYCLNATTGAYLWSYTTGSWVYSSPAVSDGKVYVGSCDHKVYCLNATTGAFMWSYTTGNWVRSSPAVSDGRVYVGSWDCKLYAFGLPSLSDFDSLFKLNYVRVVYPSENVVKPLDRHWASTSDWTSSAFLTTKLTNFTEGFDTDSNFVNQTSGRPTGAQETGIVSFGGPIVNVPVYYYEVNKVAPVLHVDTPGARGAGEPWSLWYYQNGTSITATAAGIDEHNDYFLIEVFKDGDGRNVLLAYGISGKGTYAAGKYFHNTMYPNIQSYNVGWIIVKWEDTNGDSFVNGPGDGDTYTPIASG
jgi:hypothetical protein